MDWLRLENPAQLEDIKKASTDKPVLIFKHSSRCSTSSLALDRLCRNWKIEDSAKVTLYFLDLIGFREISNEVARIFAIDHESPQVILIRDSKAIYENSHMGISYREIMEEVER